MGEFIKYSKQKPKEYKEYLCRFQHPITGEWGAEYLKYTDEGLMVEHPDYYNLQWYKEENGQSKETEQDELWNEVMGICVKTNYYLSMNHIEDYQNELKKLKQFTITKNKP